VAIPAGRHVMKRKQKETKIQEFVYRDTTKVEREMNNYTSNNWSYQNSKKRKKKKKKKEKKKKKKRKEKK
jgi:hypothetical protein